MEAGCPSSTSVRSHSVVNQYDVSSCYFSSPNSQHVCLDGGGKEKSSVSKLYFNHRITIKGFLIQQILSKPSVPGLMLSEMIKADIRVVETVQRVQQVFAVEA